MDVYAQPKLEGAQKQFRQFSPSKSRQAYFFLKNESVTEPTFYFFCFLSVCRIIVFEPIGIYSSNFVYLSIIKIYQMESRKGWSEIEDDRLVKIIKKYGTKNWSLISDKLSLGTIFQRTGKQCRQRWCNNLNPHINKKAWTKEEDQILFEVHRQKGSKWKEISNHFPGRTDNAIKNHFYSTVRKSLRAITKMRGLQNSAITMKSIKPYVLSSIVENSQLTNLIVQLGRTKVNSSNKLNIDEGILQSICNQLQRITIQYQQKRQISELTKKIGSSSSSPDPEEQFSPSAESPEPNNLPGEMEPAICESRAIEMKQYFEDQFNSHQNERLDLTETHHESKERHQVHFRDNVSVSGMGQSQELKGQTANRSLLFGDKQICEDSEIFEEQGSNYFGSPSCGRKKELFPELSLIGRISRNSHPSPSYSSKPEDRQNMVASREYEQQQPLEIQFDPHEFLQYYRMQARQSSGDQDNMEE